MRREIKQPKTLRPWAIFNAVIGVWLIFAIYGIFHLSQVRSHAAIDLKKPRVRTNVVLLSVSKSPPSPGQETIDLAMEYYDIELPERVAWPKYDPSLKERGLIEIKGRVKQVSIGPAAFSSWALLGATLVHEIEIHGRQNFFTIAVLNRVGTALFQGALGERLAEEQAYTHEVMSKKRLGLTDGEVSGLIDTRDVYYPQRPIDKFIIERMGP